MQKIPTFQNIDIFLEVIGTYVMSMFFLLFMSTVVNIITNPNSTENYERIWKKNIVSDE